jgi:hypothetical protein
MTVMSPPESTGLRGTEIRRAAETMHFSSATPGKPRNTNRYVNFLW